MSIFAVLRVVSLQLSCCTPRGIPKGELPGQGYVGRLFIAQGSQPKKKITLMAGEPQLGPGRQIRLSLSNSASSIRQGVNLSKPKYLWSIVP